VRKETAASNDEHHSREERAPAHVEIRGPPGRRSAWGVNIEMQKKRKEVEYRYLVRRRGKRTQNKNRADAKGRRRAWAYSAGVRERVRGWSRAVLIPATAERPEANSQENGLSDHEERGKKLPERAGKVGKD